jgi:hypothetical protein
MGQLQSAEARTNDCRFKHDWVLPRGLLWKFSKLRAIAEIGRIPYRLSEEKRFQFMTMELKPMTGGYGLRGCNRLACFRQFSQREDLIVVFMTSPAFSRATGLLLRKKQRLVGGESLCAAERLAPNEARSVTSEENAKKAWL